MVIGVAFVAFVAGVFYSAGLLLSTPIQLCRKNKKSRDGKGADFCSPLWGCSVRKSKGDRMGWQYAVAS